MYAFLLARPALVGFDQNRSSAKWRWSQRKHLLERSGIEEPQAATSVRTAVRSIVSTMRTPTARSCAEVTRLSSMRRGARGRQLTGAISAVSSSPPDSLQEQPNCQRPLATAQHHSSDTSGQVNPAEARRTCPAAWPQAL
jgi:hypothetical protein